MSQLVRVTELLTAGDRDAALLVLAGMQDEILDRLEEVEASVAGPRPRGGGLTIVLPHQGGQ